MRRGIKRSGLGTDASVGWFMQSYTGMDGDQMSAYPSFSSGVHLLKLSVGVDDGGLSKLCFSILCMECKIPLVLFDKDVHDVAV